MSSLRVSKRRRIVKEERESLIVSARGSTLQVRTKTIFESEAVEILNNGKNAKSKALHPKQMTGAWAEANRIGLDEPFCAASPAKYRCRLKGTCEECFESSVPCSHYVESRLHLLLVGHNPADHVWTHGYSYGNPSNRMWKLLTGNFACGYRGCVPNGTPLEFQNQLPNQLKIGFTPVAVIPGSDAAEFSDDFMRSWVPNLHARLVSHRDRVRKNENSSDYEGPSIVAFTGKRQFMMMYPTKKEEPRSLPFGRVPAEMLPPNWPLDKQKCQVWVLPSSSGRAAMTHEQRAGPYRALAEEYHKCKEVYNRN